MVDDVELASVIARIAAQEHADPASDDLTVPLAVELADAQARIGELEVALADAQQGDAKLLDDIENVAAAQAANARLVEALRKLLARDERNTCTHEETHRGGSIWEICDNCGAKWADDRGGKPQSVDPPEWVAARAALASSSPSDGPDYPDTDTRSALYQAHLIAKRDLPYESFRFQLAQAGLKVVRQSLPLSTGEA